MSANLVTPENAPRDYAGLMALSRAVRYRLALGMALFPNESEEEQGFVSADDNTQVQAIMTALTARDSGAPPSNGQGQPSYPQQPQVGYAPPPAAVPPTHMGAPAPVTPQPLAVSPAPYQPPPGYPQPGGYAPAGQPPQGYPQHQQQYANPPAPMAPPPGAPMPPQYQPPQAAPHPQMPPSPQAAPPPPPPAYAPPAPPTYTPPAPAYAPPPPMAAPPGAYAPQQQHQYTPPQQQQQYAPAPQAPAPMMRQPSTTGDPRNAGSQPIVGMDVKLNEIETTLLGVARTQNMLFNLILQLAQNQLGMDKQTIACLLIQHAQSGEPMKFFDPAALQGKAG